MTQLFPHRIRLLGPWECHPLSSGGLPTNPRRLTLPCRWSDVAGTVRLQRRFHWPGVIDPLERVWITFARVTGKAEVSLNGTVLGQHQGEGSFEFEITSLLRARNVLQVDVTGEKDGGVEGEVALEVRRTAFLRAVQVERAGGELRLRGEVAGEALRSLEVYVLLDNATVAYRTTDAGSAFDFRISVPEAMRQVRVELVDGGVVWYQVVVDL